jgi:hypothetical protein
MASNPISSCDFTQNTSTGLGRALERRAIYLDQSILWRIAEEPLEIIQQ